MQDNVYLRKKSLVLNFLSWVVPILFLTHYRYYVYNCISVCV